MEGAAHYGIVPEQATLLLKLKTVISSASPVQVLSARATGHTGANSTLSTYSKSISAWVWDVVSSHV